MQAPNGLDEGTIVQCFMHIHNPLSSQAIRKQADSFLIQSQIKVVPLMKVLLQIFAASQNTYNPQIKLQALIHLSNVIKRNWNNKRLLKTYPDYPQVKKSVSAQIIQFLENAQYVYIKSLFDLVGFIAKSDYPHSFPQFTNYTLLLLSKLKMDRENVLLFKLLRDIYLQLGQRKGFSNPKNFQQGPRKILNSIVPITEMFRQELSKSQKVDNMVVKISKYCDQIVLSLMRVAPYSYLDDENFMLITGHICNKLQHLLSVHSTQSSSDKAALQKNIKSLVYLLGCLQVTNPCIMGLILTEYIKVLFYIIPKPQIFAKTATLKYALLSLRKLIKQFTYYAQNSVFQKSLSSSNPKSSNYMQLRNLTSKAYSEQINEQTMFSLFNFLLTDIMNIKSKQDQVFSVSLDQNTAYQKSIQKQLSVHTCGILLAQAIIQRFTEKMLLQIYNMIQSCIQNNWSNVDTPILNNFLSILSILPKCCRRPQLLHLSKFPIIKVLQFVHGSSSIKIKQKFPVLISGWLDIFNNQQLGQLVEALMSYVTEGAQNNNMEILLYSCYSLNKVITLRSTVIDCATILQKIFPVAIKVFNNTDNPQILWPLITLVSTLLTKQQFDTNIIVNSIESNSLNSLISNQSQLLVEALCDMFKSFLCIIPRNKPAVVVFKLVYHFLNIHLAKTGALYHEKCVNLWYFSIREFSAVNQCNQEYYQLFQNHFKRCMFNIKPVLIYILQQYMLLGLIQSKLDTFINIVIDFYKQGEIIEANDILTTLPNSANSSQVISNASKEQSINLRIAALSFQITLITKYNIEQVNSQQMLYVIMKDFCSNSNNQNNQGNSSPFNNTYQENSVKSLTNTLNNSLLSIINRYLMCHPQYFFSYLKSKLDLLPITFYQVYFKNMQHLTSRTAIKLNTLALISILDKLPGQLNPAEVCPCALFAVKTIITELEQISRSPIGSNQGQVQNSPIIRFSQSILSQRKQQIRKQGIYDNIDMKQFFLTQFKLFLDKQAMNLQQFAQLAENSEIGKQWGNRIFRICQ